MKLTIELSHYPFEHDYRPIIKATVKRLNALDSVQVKTYPTATVIVGDYQEAMSVLNDTIAWSYENYGKCVFIAKFIPGYEALESSHA